MVSLDTLEEYRKDLNDGIESIKKVNNNLIYIIGILFFITLINTFIMVEFYHSYTSESFSISSFKRIFLEEETFQILFYIDILNIFSSFIIFLIHKNLKKNRFKNFLENNMLIIASKHKKIFKDHPKEIIENFILERNRNIILNTLSKQLLNINFLIFNYENLFMNESNITDNKNNS